MDQFHFTRLTYEAQLNLALASIKQAEATLKNSEANLEYTEIRSPEDGVVIERKVDPGQTVAASFQTPELFTIALEMDKHVYVYASVDEADIGLIRDTKLGGLAGQTHLIAQCMAARALAPVGVAVSSSIQVGAAARVTEFVATAVGGRAVKFTVDAYPGDLFEGRVFQIRMNSTTTQNVVTYPVIIEAKNPDLKLMPGMTANISFQIETKEDVLRVPAAALRFVPQPSQVRPEDRQYVEVPTSPSEGGPKRTAGEKAEQSRSASGGTSGCRMGRCCGPSLSPLG